MSITMKDCWAEDAELFVKLVPVRTITTQLYRPELNNTNPKGGYNLDFNMCDYNIMKTT